MAVTALNLCFHIKNRQIMFKTWTDLVSSKQQVSAFDPKVSPAKRNPRNLIKYKVYDEWTTNISLFSMEEQSKIYHSMPKSTLTETFFSNSVKENSGHVESVVVGRSKLNLTVFRGDDSFSSFWFVSTVVNWTRLGPSILKSILHPSELDFILETNEFDYIVLTKLAPYWGQMTSADYNLFTWTIPLRRRVRINISALKLQNKIVLHLFYTININTSKIEYKLNILSFSFKTSYGVFIKLWNILPLIRSAVAPEFPMHWKIPPRDDLFTYSLLPKKCPMRKKHSHGICFSAASGGGWGGGHGGTGHSVLAGKHVRQDIWMVLFRNGLSYSDHLRNRQNCEKGYIFFTKKKNHKSKWCQKGCHS